MQGLPVFGKTEGRGQKEVANDQKGIRPYQHDGGPSDSKPSRTDGKPRSTKQPKNTHQLAASLETDLTYHHALNEHVKNAYPNINSLSPDMLRDLSIPTEILSKPPVARPKAKEEKRTVVKAAKDENKPFKRQSYHVAIAYHIHLKQVKMSKTVEYVDPTYPARRLKDEEAKKV